MTDLAEMQATIAAAAAQVGPRSWDSAAAGRSASGVVIDHGKVLTCAHNLRREEVTVTLADGRRETGSVAAADPDLDLAVLSVDTGDIARIAWEPGEAPGIGSPVLALANPGGRGLRVTLGFVSSAGRSFRLPRGRRVEARWSTPPPSPVARPGGRWWTPRDGSWASTRCVSTAA